MDNLRLLYENDEDFALMAREHALDFIGTTSLTFAKEWLESAIGSEMRQSTPEERAEYERMLDKHSIDTGVNIFELDCRTESTESVQQDDLSDSRETCDISDSDVWNVACEIYYAGGYKDNGSEPNPPTEGIRKLLDRQASITHEETLRYSAIGAREAGKLLREQIAELQAQVDRLTAERDEAVADYCHSCREREKLYERIEKLDNDYARLVEERDVLAADLAECMELNDRLSDEREKWRGTCGMMLDAAHEIERIMAEMEAK